MLKLLWLFICVWLTTPAALTAQAATLDDIEVYPDRVIFVLDSAVNENIQILSNPPRLIIDLPNTLSALAQGIQEGRGSLLAKVEASHPEDGSSAARTVLSLKAPVSYRAKWEGGRLTIQLLSEDGGPPPAVVVPVPAAPPAAVVPVSKPSRPKPKAGKGFLIQAGSFSKEEVASAFKEELTPAVPGWSISTITVKGAVFYRLRAGPFATRSEAEAAVQKIAAMGENAIIIPAP